MNFSEGLAMCKYARHENEVVRTVYQELLRMNFAKHPNKDEVLARIFSDEEISDMQFSLWCIEADKAMIEFISSATLEEAREFCNSVMNRTIDTWKDV